MSIRDNTHDGGDSREFSHLIRVVQPMRHNQDGDEGK
jgi:hypothetical protein